MGNRQRTSSRNGILKAEAVLCEARILEDEGVAVPADLTAAGEERLQHLRARWSTVPGQASGVSWRAFCMLVGLAEVKPDRMIRRYVATALGRSARPPSASRRHATWSWPPRRASASRPASSTTPSGPTRAPLRRTPPAHRSSVSSDAGRVQQTRTRPSGGGSSGSSVVGDLAGEQAALAVVADAVAAAEADRHVAGFGEVEQARVAVVPRDGEVAADERDGRAGAGWAVGRVRRPVAGLDDPGGVDGDGAERLGRDALGRDAAGGERGADRAHEGRRVRRGSSRRPWGRRRVEHREVEAAGDVVVGAARVPGARPAVGDEAVAVARARRAARRPRRRRRARRGCGRRAATRPAACCARGPARAASRAPGSRRRRR